MWAVNTENMISMPRSHERVIALSLMPLARERLSRRQCASGFFLFSA